MNLTINTNQEVLDFLLRNGFSKTASIFAEELAQKENVALASISKLNTEMTIDTLIASFNPCENDPHGSTSMPIYQTATFKQLGATDFGEYDYTRSGNPTRDALQKIVALLEGYPNANAFAFSTGMAAISAVVRLVEAGEEVIVNDDSYGGTYRVMSKIATRHGIIVTYANLAGSDGSATLSKLISSKTKLVMIESPTNPLQRICDVGALAQVCHANNHLKGTLLSIDNTMMSPILSQPMKLGADIVIHSATKFMSGHADTMAGVVIVKTDIIDGDKNLGDHLYFYQNAEGTALAPFDCWLVLRGIRTMSLRVSRQQDNALIVASWLRTVSQVKTVIYGGFSDHPDIDIHRKQASGGGCVVCFTTGNFMFSKHIVTATKLFKITVSFGSVASVISVPGQMSHASIPAEVRQVRDFPEDLIRMSIGIESPVDLIQDLWQAISSYSA